MEKPFPFAEQVLACVTKSGEQVQDNDVLVISSKYLAMAQGRYLDLATVKPSKDAIKLSRLLSLDPPFAEVVIREADVIFGGVKSFAICIRKGLIAPNAGVDRSNIYPGHVILSPKNVWKEADSLRQTVKARLNKDVGVVIADSRLIPTKRGTIGIALGTAGLEALKDMRGHRDLFGKRLRVTRMAIADDLASAAELIMGEADEATPIVIARGEGRYWRISNSRKRMTVPHDQCIYIKGLSSGIIYTKRRGWVNSKI